MPGNNLKPMADDRQYTAGEGCFIAILLSVVYGWSTILVIIGAIRMFSRG